MTNDSSILKDIPVPPQNNYINITGEITRWAKLPSDRFDVWLVELDTGDVYLTDGRNVPHLLNWIANSLSNVVMFTIETDRDGYKWIVGWR